LGLRRLRKSIISAALNPVSESSKTHMKHNELTAKAVANARDGKHTDGDGLQFQVKGKSKRWVLRYRWQGRDKELGIGKYPAMTLAAARARRDELSEIIENGGDPRSNAASASTITFREDMDNFVEYNRRRWRHSHHTEWLRVMNDKAAPLMDKPSGTITESDILAIIKPMWEAKNYTASRVLNRIASVLDRARRLDKSRFPASDPCVRIRELLPQGARPETVPMRPLPWRDLPAFYAAVRNRRSVAARPLEFMLLTPCGRLNEYRRARWAEIDGDVWHVPGAHTKSKLPRRVPLTPAAVELLDAIRPTNVTPDSLIFSGRLSPSVRRNGQVDTPSGMIGDHVMQDLIYAMGFDCHVHGLRATWSTWIADHALDQYDKAKEISLDHLIGSEVYRAYDRSDRFDQRREATALYVAYMRGAGTSSTDPRAEGGG
jgi:integrase